MGIFHVTSYLISTEFKYLHEKKECCKIVAQSVEKIENRDDMEKLMKHLKMTGRRGREKKLLQKIKNALHNERPPKCSF